MARTYTFNVVTGDFNLHDIFFRKVFRLDALPTLVLAKEYAGGGQGEGYSVASAGNAFTQTHPGFYRAEDVSLENSSVTSSLSDAAGSFDVGNINANEWLRYDTYNPNSGAHLDGGTRGLSMGCLTRPALSRCGTHWLVRIFMSSAVLIRSDQHRA